MIVTPQDLTLKGPLKGPGNWSNERGASLPIEKQNPSKLQIERHHAYYEIDIMSNVAYIE